MVYDRVNKIGGAERVLLALHQLFPEAPLFTAVYDPKGAPWAKVFPQVIPSFLQRFPFAKRHHEAYFWLMPLAFESFNFNDFDLVISVTSEAAKGIITQPKTRHICYCLSTTRYLWQSYDQYFKNKFWRLLTRPLVAYLRHWDKIAAQRPDIMVAISENVSQRIKKYYRREATVIYPPITLSGDAEVARVADNYFLVVSRLVPYKRIDIAIEAFNNLRLPLKIVGSGTEGNKLKSMAKPNIKFLGQDLTDKELLAYYQNCRAIIFPGEEDFGLVPLEAQSCGKPVIAFKGGGVLESVVSGETGDFFYPQTAGALEKAVREFKEEKYTGEKCQNNAQRFSQKIFVEKFKKLVKNMMEENVSSRKGDPSTSLGMTARLL